jgi:hypothetical protein
MKQKMRVNNKIKNHIFRKKKETASFLLIITN